MPGSPVRPACAHCGYDLSGVTAESGACPECGAGYSRSRLTRQAEALARLSLNLTVFGAAAIVIAFGLGQCIATMPSPTQGNPGQAGSATLLLALVPAALFTLGVCLLSASSGHAVLSRGWPAAAAVLYLASSIFAVATIDNTVGSYAAIAPMLQLAGWIPLNAWLLRFSQAIAFVGAAAVLRRIARDLDATATAQALTVCIVLGLAAAAMHLFALLRDASTATRGPWTDVIDNWVMVVTAMPSLTAALGVVGAGLVVRSQWIAGRPTKPLLPEPNPPAARQ